ncbi:MAG: hypothetical protein R3F49_08700 [Planctomycetota bacterium]
MPRQAIALAIALCPMIGSPVRGLIEPAAPAPPAAGAQDARRPDTASLVGAAGNWGAPGGGPARSGAAATQVPRGPVSDAWSVTFEGRVLREPLVQGDVILVEESVSETEFRVHVLDRVSGAPLGAALKVNGVAPEATMDAGLVVLRAASDRLGFYRLGPRGLTRITSRALGGPVEHTLLVPEGVLATVSGKLTLLARDQARGKALWTSDIAPIGDLAAHGGVVFAAVRGSNLVEVVEARLEDGRLVRSAAVPVGADANGSLRVTLAPGLAAVSLDPPVAWRKGNLATASCVARGGSTIEPTAAGNVHLPPTTVGDGYVCRPYNVNAEVLLVHVANFAAEGATILATPQQHPEVLPLPRSTYASGVLLLGGNAVDLSTNRFLWKTPHRVTLPPVPARERVLLVVDEGRRLVALADAVRRAPLAFAAAEDLPEFEGTLATAGGALEAARVALRGGSPTSAAAKPSRDTEAAVAAALALTGPKDELRWAASPEAAVRASRLLSARRRAEGLAALANDARKAGDAELLSDLIEGALASGAEEREVAAAQKTLDALVKAPRTPKADRVAELRRAMAEMEARATEVAQDWFEALAEATHPAAFELRAALIEEVLRATPQDAAAARAVRRLLPAGIEPAEPFDPLEWLAFARAAHETPVHLVLPPERETDQLTYAELQLGRAQHTWRKDLIALETEHLLILSTPDRPGALARCLSLASLTCDALTAIFAEYGREERLDRKLVVRLYPTRADYLKESEKQGVPPGALAWTGGFYSPIDNMSRLFIPDDDAELGDTLRTITHEITHHWLERRCPMWSLSETRERNYLQRGYWIVEGFAGFVEEWLFDTNARTWRTLDPRAERLDIVAHTSDGARLPWKVAYEISQIGFHRDKFTGQAPITSAWLLGAQRVIEARMMYYCQAAATCAFLYHGDEGAHRRALLEYLRAFYTSEGELDVTKAFGMGYDKLGERVQSFARAVSAGEFNAQD